jgi:hypothetical protein
LSNDRREWIRANSGDVWPDLPSPQALDAFEQILNAGERRYLPTTLASESALGPLVRAFCGRLYFNLAQLRRVCDAERIPLVWLFERIGLSEARSFDEPEPRRSAPARLLDVTERLRSLLRRVRARRVLRQHETRSASYLARMRDVDPRDLSDVEVWSLLEAWTDEAPSYLQPVLPIAGLLLHEAPIRRTCARAGVRFEALFEKHVHHALLPCDWSQRSDCDAADRGREVPPKSVRELTTFGAVRAHTIESYSGWREQMELNVARVMSGLRRCHLALADRFVEREWLAAPGEYFMLHLREIAPIVNGQERADALGPIVARRIDQQERQRSIEMPPRLSASAVVKAAECADRNTPLGGARIDPSYY